MTVQHQLLKTLEPFLTSIDAVIGIFYAGSTATGFRDAYSDIDCFLVVEKFDPTLMNRIRTFLAKYWEVRFESGNAWGHSFFLGEQFIKLEIDILLPKDHLTPQVKFQGIKIIKDTKGLLAKVSAASEKLKVVVDHATAVQLFLDIRDGQLYIAKHAVRGWRWSAMGEVHAEAEQLFQVLAKLKGRTQFGFREAESFLTVKELQLLAATRCPTTDVQAIKTAAHGLWNFLQYVESYYKKKTKRRLHISCDDDALLQMTESIYRDVREGTK